MSNLIGKIHSFQSLGTVDGPGLRCVVFMQGCPLRCACCHNPDTWAFEGGTESDTDTLVKKILRFRNYFGEKGGVTVSGGEPLMQAAFVTELFTKLKENGIHTALDTSGCLYNDEIAALLKVTDLVLLDHKYPTPADYYTYTKCKQESTEFFLERLQEQNIATWLRRVIIPELNDTEEATRQLKAVRDSHPCVTKTELLPFRKLCMGKYENLGIPFPLADTPEATAETIQKLQAILDKSNR